MSKTLILCGNVEWYFFSDVKSDNIEVYSAYQNAKAFRFPKKSFQYIPKLRWMPIGKLGEWSKKIKEYDKVIIFDSAYDFWVSNFLRKHVFKKGAFIFYWNKLGKEENVYKVLKREQDYFGIYSYDKEDCDKYQIDFNTTTYFEKSHIVESDKYKKNVIFLGRDKGRTQEICVLKQYLDEKKITSFFYIVGDKKEAIESLQMQEKVMSYKEYINYVYNSDVILDILQSVQKGCSLRTMESLFYKKKLITNKEEISKEPFYSRENIFILGKDNIEELYNFIKTPYKEPVENISKYYSMEEWEKRFINKKTLLLVSDKKRYFFPYIKDKNIVIDEIWNNDYWKNSYWIKKIIRKLKLPIAHMYGAWTKELSQFSKIIIFDGAYDRLLTYYLDKKAKTANKYIFCWNARERLKHILDANYKIYSFDKTDCEICHFNYLSTFFTKDITLKNKKKERDVLFIGELKNRAEEIYDFYTTCKSKGIEAVFHVVGTQKYYKEMQLSQKRIEYEEYLEMIAGSISILDIINENQNGFSMRVMESIFFGKKLITNNIELVKEDFYNPNNIFLIGKDDISNLCDFLETPYEPIDVNVLNQFEIHEWIARIEG